MSGDNPNAKTLREREKKNAKGDSRPGFTSILKHPDAKGDCGKSKLHHKKGGRK